MPDVFPKPTDSGDTAFPSAAGETIGLTKREYFAAIALQGLLASDTTNHDKWTDIAESAVLSADALIAELNKAK